MRLRDTTALLALLCAPARADTALPPGFVDAATMVPGLRTDIRYAGPHNFTGRPVVGYEAPRGVTGMTHERFVKLFAIGLP